MNNGIAVFGGSFDPVHLGHILTAIDIQNTFHFKELVFMPCGQAVFKNQLKANPQQRLDMLKLALEKYPNFKIDAREMQRKGPSYTILSLEELRKEYSVPITWILGEDAFQSFHQWHQYQNILKLAHLIILARPNQQKPYAPELLELLKEHQTQNIDDLNTGCGKIYYYPHSDYPYSSTAIRKNLLNHVKPEGLNPKVLAYITKNYCY
jgi:nicotinate-nucleotide adenylyltransferase